MKKFLALALLCAGLTMSANVHQVNTAAIPGQKVMKANNLTTQLTSGVVSKQFMEGAKQSLASKKITADNLVNKRAPRRMNDQELVSKNHVTFLYVVTYDENGNYVEDDPFYAGSGAYWYPNLSDGLYFAGLYWDNSGSTYYLPLDVDYETGEVALSWGILLDDDTISPGGRTRTDTIRWSALMSEDYFLNENQNDCKGTLYEDGSIIFDDNYVYYGYEIHKKYVNNKLTTTDTTDFLKVYVGTEILAANGNLTYTREQNGAADNSYVFMYQNNDSLFVGNMWNYGVPNIAMTIDNKSKMHYDCVSEVGEDGTVYLGNPIWDIDDSWIEGGLGMCYGVGGFTLDAEGYIEDFTWGFEGDVTPDQITWDYTAASNGYHLFYGYQNNVLTWLNGDKFIIPGGDVLIGDVNNDEVVDVTDVTVLIDRLLKGDLDDSDEFNSAAADINEDGSIDITDITTLLDKLVRG